MKLIFVTDNGFSKKGDNYYFSAPNLAHVNHLKKYFNEFVFVARNDTYDKSSFPINDNKSVHLIGRYNFFELKNILEAVIDDADAVICYGINGYIAYRIARKKNKQVIAYSGGDVYDFLISRDTIKGRVAAPIIRLLEKEKFKNADYAHYCASFLVERYPTYGKSLVASGVNIEHDSINLEKRLIKIAEINSSEKRIVIGLIGHTRNNLKGIGTAIKAISKLHTQFNVELQIVGRGEHGKYTELSDILGVGDKVKFLGTKKAGDELFQWLDSVDIYIQPSQIEGLPRATIEAMSRACPIISSNVGALPSLIDDYFQINHADYIALAEKISCFLKDSNLMTKQAEDNFNKSREYAPEVREKKYDSFYGLISKGD